MASARTSRAMWGTRPQPSSSGPAGTTSSGTWTAGWMRWRSTPGSSRRTRGGPTTSRASPGSELLLLVLEVGEADEVARQRWRLLGLALEEHQHVLVGLAQLARGQEEALDAQRQRAYGLHQHGVVVEGQPVLLEDPHGVAHEVVQLAILASEVGHDEAGERPVLEPRGPAAHNDLVVPEELPVCLGVRDVARELRVALQVPVGRAAEQQVGFLALQGQERRIPELPVRAAQATGLLLAPGLAPAHDPEQVARLEERQAL